MNTLPPESISHISTFLTPSTCIQNRAVCKSWQRDTSRHCGYFLIQDRSRPRPNALSSSANIEGAPIQVAGSADDTSTNASMDQNSIHSRQFDTLQFMMTCLGRANSSSNSVIFDRDDGNRSESAIFCRRRFKRTRGHLPEPNVFTDEGEGKPLTFQTRCKDFVDDVKDADVATEISAVAKSEEGDRFMHEMEVKRISLSSQIALAIRFESMNANCTQMNFITSLDLESARISSDSTKNNLNQNVNANMHQSKAKVQSMKKIIDVVDLSSLCHLKRLSVRGCSGLHTLRLPSSLMALDASACTKLKEISFPECSNVMENGPTCRPDGSSCDLNLEAANLNGCRSLISTQFLSFALKNVKELDMTSVSSMSGTLIAEAMKAARRLKNASLRYIATNEMIDALAASDAAGEISLMDVAFSHVTDSAIETLVRRAVKLERCNLRGCKMISACCYNQVPIHLSRSFEADDGINQFQVKYDDGDEGQKRKRRKGDNIFYFVNS